MNKVELVSRIVENLEGDINGKKLTKKDTAVIVDAVFDVITDALVDGEEVKIANFGKFRIREVAERAGHNPQTQERIVIPAYRTPAFKASSALRTAIKEA